MNQKVREIFTQAAVLPSEDREAYLTEACGEDAELRLEVQRLLVDAERADSFFGNETDDATVAADGSGKTSGKPATPIETTDSDGDDEEEVDPLSLLHAFKESDPDASLPESLTEKAGDQVGPYKLLQPIGEGGFGGVWMAEQSEPISRKVALKVIKAGMDTKEVLARFEAERQAVALMDHTHIAKVLDAGATKSGRPWFAMELVKGVSITEFCDEQKLGPRERLELFGDVCSAISHAHQKGVIHRDIKPSNVMVTLDGDKPVVKVIDFGIAKATQSKLTDKTLFTAFEQMIGTPVYMSPEQAGMGRLDIDTRSDIYSLGVLLYELLTGNPPFNGKTLISAGYEEMRRIIREEEPLRPSLRLSTVSDKDETTRITSTHRAEPQKLSRLVRGDLDWIVMKAIEKDRSRRYETANAFTADIGRYLNDQPVEAAAPSVAYRFRKFARRNKVAIRIAALILFVLIPTIGVSTWQAFEMNQARKLSLMIERSWNIARVKRLGNEAGRRWRASDELEKGADFLDLLKEDFLKEEDRDAWRRRLQNEAFQTLSMIDLRLSEDGADSWQKESEDNDLIRLGPDFSTWAHVTADGRIEIRNAANVVMKSWEGPASATCRSLHFDPGQGIRLAAVCQMEDGSFRATIWNLETEETIPIGSVEGPDALCFSDDGSLLAYTHETILVVKSLDGKVADRVIPIESPARVVRLNQDGDTQQIALGWSEKPGAALLDLNSESPGKPVDRFGNATVYDLAWNPRGRRLAMGCDDGQVIVWDTKEDENFPGNKRYLSGESARIRHIDWHPRGVLLAGSTERGKVHLWHTISETVEVTWSSGAKRIIRPQFSPDGSRLGPVIGGRLVSFLEVTEGRGFSHARGHPGKIYGAWWRARGRDLARVFSTAGDDGVRIWNRRGFEKAFIPELGARSAIFTRKGLIITGKEGISFRTVEGGDIPGSRVLRVGRPHRISPSVPCFGADFDPGNHRLAVAARVENGTVSDSNPSEDQVLVYQLDPGSNTLPDQPEQVLSAPKHTAFVDISPDGMWLAAGTNGGRGIRVWKWEDGTNSWVIFKDESNFETKGSAHAVFHREHPSLGGKEWVVVCGERTFEFFTLPDWIPQPIPPTLDFGSGTVTFSPGSGTFVASGGQGYGIRGNNIHLLMEPEFDSQSPLCFSPDGSILLTAEKGNFLRLWDFRVLRSSLADLNLDLDLMPFPSAPLEPDPIDSVILEEE